MTPQHDRSRVAWTPLILAVFAAIVSSTSIDPNDTWWHIRSGEYYLQHHAIPSTDVFSHTVDGQNVYTHEWLSQVILYLVHHHTGFVGIRVLNSLMAVVTVLLLWRFFRSATGRLLPVLLGIAVVYPDFLGRMNTRPEIFTLPLLVGFVHFILHRDRTRLPSLRTILLVAGVTCLWANLHGMALLGLMFFAAYAVGEALTLLLKPSYPIAEWGNVTPVALKGDVILIVACVLAALISPLGVDIYVHAYQGRHFLPGPLGIMEWLSPFMYLGELMPRGGFPWINTVALWQFLFILIPFAYCFSVPYLAARRRMPNLGEVMMVLLAVVQGATIVRFRWLFFLPMFWIVRALAQAVADPEPGETRAPGRASIVWSPVALLVIACSLFVMATRGITFSKAIDTDSYPIGISNFLTDLGAKGNLFNGYNWGGYLIYRLWPNYRVFIDGRTDLYALAGNNLMLDHVAIAGREPGCERLLDHYGVDILIADNKAYFPCSEMENEIAFMRQERRRQLAMAAGGSAEMAALDKSGDTQLENFRTEWIPMLVNMEGSVYLRRAGRNHDTASRLSQLFDRLGVPFDTLSGPDLAVLIEKHPDVAVKYHLLPEAAVARLLREPAVPGGDAGVKIRLEMGRALVSAELYRDAIATLEEALEIDRYNNETLMLLASSYHLVGENERAYLYLERSANIGRNASAQMLAQHCASHPVRPSPSVRRLPGLSDLAATWKSASR